MLKWPARKTETRPACRPRAIIENSVPRGCLKPPSGRRPRVARRPRWAEMGFYSLARRPKMPPRRGGAISSLDIARADLWHGGISFLRPCRVPYESFFGLLSPGPRSGDVGASSPARGRHRAKSMHSLDIASEGHPHGRRCPLAPGPGPYVGFLGLLSPGASVVYFYTIKMSRKTTQISLRSQQYRPPKVGAPPSLSCIVSVRNQRQGAAQSPVNFNFIS